MKIYTSYFAKLKKMPKDIVCISICAKVPEWYQDEEYKKLAPSYSILMGYKNNHDEKLYIERFNNEVLGKLNAEKVLDDLSKLSNGEDCVLLCYEKSSDFCHRHLVAKWLNEKLGIQVEEWTE